MNFKYEFKKSIRIEIYHLKYIYIYIIRKYDYSKLFVY